MDEQAVPPKPPAPRTSAWRLLLGVTLFGVVSFAGSAGLVWYLVNSAESGEVNEGSQLEVHLEGMLSDAPVQPGLFEDPEDLPPTVTEVATAIRSAGSDERITGLLLRLDGVSAGWGAFQELRDAVGDFRAAGKPCIAYTSTVFTNQDYYLASACDRVLAHPAGAMFVTGLAMELTYYKGTFELLGVEPEFEHVGDFKSFIEVYELTGPSEAASQANEALLDSLWEQMLTGIAEGRGVEREVVAEWVQHPSMTPQGNIERGMIDGVAYLDALKQHLTGFEDEGWLGKLVEVVDEEVDEDALTSLDEYLKDQRAAESSGASIAVVYAEGDIVSGAAEPGLFGDDGSLKDGEFAEWMEEVREDDAVKAVVVRVNSRGGSGLASDEMLREVARTKAAGKPVVVSFGDYAASGGYLMSCTADAIVAHPGSITGSIGVFGGKFDLSGTYGKLGMTQHAFKRGELSDMLSLSRPFSDEGRQVFKDYLASFYDIFVGQVAEGRHMERDAVHAVAQGRVWTGVQALERGLVDQLGGLDDAIALAAEKAGVSEPTVRRVPARKTFFEMVMEDMAETSAQVELGLPIPEEALRELRVLDAIGRSGGVGAMLPGSFRVR
jgi:protease-4